MTTENESKPEQQAAIHPLLAREIRPIRNWHEWLLRWQMAASAEEMISLLHYGFDVNISQGDFREPKYSQVDRLALYFAIADGWTDFSALSKAGDRDVAYDFGRDERGNQNRISPQTMRQVVAKKAFDMLCSNLFKLELQSADWSGGFDWRWQEHVLDDKLFPIILSFFSPDDLSLFRVQLDIRNLGVFRDMSHNRKQAVAFLLNLVSFLWRWQEEDVKSWFEEEEQQATAQRNKVRRARIEGAKPWTIEVLNSLGELSRLERWLPDLSQPCLDKLKEIALRSQLSRLQHPVLVDRPVATLDEACFVGSEAAWLLKEHELKKAEHARLSQLLEEELKRQEAERRIKELTPVNA